MDYKNLLVKYMAHIIDEEGIDYLADSRKPEFIDDEEWEELRGISEEATKGRECGH